MVYVILVVGIIFFGVILDEDIDLLKGRFAFVYFQKILLEIRDRD